MQKRLPSVSTRKGLAELVVETLDDMKAEQVVSLDVIHLTPITDTMIIASGRSDRHVKAIADRLIERCKEEGYKPLGVEGQDAGEWVLVDLADVIVHIMQPRVRDFYNIEKLWDFSAREEAAEM
ncbi:MAG TPA: ribosome silencing factor [Gammaproteobacteria bacterium]|nr:ribosome silencing factor [Gammaproteobacteria bacterium]